MYTFALAALAMASVAEGYFFFGGAGVAGTALTVGGGGAGLALGGAVILKGLVIGAALLASRSRGRKHGKRSADIDDQDAAFLVLNSSEPAQCYRRLICDMAAGAIPDQDKILSLFTTDVSPVSPKFEYSTAAKVGKLVKNANLCEIRYSCPLSTAEISKVFA